MPPPLLSGVLLLFLWLLLSVALGRRLLRLLRLPISDTFDRRLFVCVLGFGSLQFLPFLCFSTGLGKPLFLEIVLAGLVCLLAGDLLSILRLVSSIRAGGLRAFVAAKSFARQKAVSTPLLLFCLLILSLLFVRAVCPPVMGDAWTYHIPVAQRYLAAGKFVFLPTLVYSNWPLGLQMHYALLLAIHPDAPTGIIQFLAGVLTLLTLWRLGERLKPGVGTLAIAVLVLLDGFGSGGFWEQIGKSMVDMGLTLFATVALYALFRAQEENENASMYRTLSAIFAGLCATMKLTGMWVLLAMALIGLLTDLRSRRPNVVQNLVRYVLTGGLIVAPWFVKTWVLTGNPVYPMLYSFFGGLEWSADGWTRFQRGHLLWNTPAGQLPTADVLSRTHRTIALTCLAVGSLLVWTTRRTRVSLLVGFSGVFLAFIGFGNYFHPRFLMPALPTVAVSLAFALKVQKLTPRYARDTETQRKAGNREQGTGNRKKRENSRPAGRSAEGSQTGTFLYPVWWGILTLIAAYIACNGVLLRFGPPIGTVLRCAIGTLSREDYIRPYAADYEVAQFANRNLSANARILLGAYDYYPVLYRVEGLWPEVSLQDSIHYDSAERLESDLQRLHVGYLLLNPKYPDWCATSHACRERMEAEVPALSVLAKRHGNPLFASNGFTLYALNGKAAP